MPSDLQISRPNDDWVTLIYNTLIDIEILCARSEMCSTIVGNEGVLTYCKENPYYTGYRI